MGNNMFKREDDDISDIGHYIEFLKQEKKRNFDKNIPNSKKPANSLFSKNAICDMSNCTNYLTFTKKSVKFNHNPLKDHIINCNF